MAETKWGKNIITDLKAPNFSAEYQKAYAKFAKRILWIDDRVVPGAFQMNCSWYLRPEDQRLVDPHVHDADELLGFFGSNPDDPHDLGAEIEFWMEDEKYIITKSCLIFIPSGVIHLPLVIRRVDRPIFHFSTVTSGQYVPKKV